MRLRCRSRVLTSSLYSAPVYRGWGLNRGLEELQLRGTSYHCNRKKTKASKRAGGENQKEYSFLDKDPKGHRGCHGACWEPVSSLLGPCPACTRRVGLFWSLFYFLINPHEDIFFIDFREWKGGRRDKYPCESHMHWLLPQCIPPGAGNLQPRDVPLAGIEPWPFAHQPWCHSCLLLVLGCWGQCFMLLRFRSWL